MSRERVLIAVKAYPTLSKTYAELVCTAGFREDGSWVRIYPVPFRSLGDNKRFKKYQWIEIDLEKNPKDPRPESYRPRSIEDIRPLQTVGTKNAWKERRRLILDKNTIHTNRNQIIEAAKNNEYSLVIFKPRKIVDFIAKPEDPNWELSKEEAVKAAIRQGSLFDELELYPSDFELMPKLPWKFQYEFLDDEDKSSTLMIEDWEIGQLYWNCLEGTTPEEAVKKVRQKYLNDLAHTKDLYLFLGTTRRWHLTGQNPYVIIGTFYPPHIKQEQPSLFQDL